MKVSISVLAMLLLVFMRIQLCTLAASLPNQVTIEANSSPGFVTTNGTAFMLHGRRFFWAGTNNVNLLRTDLYSDAQIADLFSQHAQHGLKVVRFYCYMNGYGDLEYAHEPGSAPGPTTTSPVPYPLQPTLGTYNESVLERLDLILSEASSNGMFVILIMQNFEPEYGGIQWLVDQVLGGNQTHPKEAFYYDPGVKQAYQSYVSCILNRKNTKTGIYYYSDPTILSIDLMNEPHTTNQYEEQLGLPPGQMVREWLDEMSTFVRSIDPNHLISSGEEGYRADGPTAPPTDNWINGGYKGVDFVGDCKLQNIDFATIHVYPDNWDIPAQSSELGGQNYTWVVPNVLLDRSEIAHGVGKPIIMEEYGAQRGYGPSRNAVLGTLLTAAEDQGFAGTLVWQLWPWPVDDMSYDFGYGQDGSEAVLTHAQNMNAKQ